MQAEFFHANLRFQKEKNFEETFIGLISLETKMSILNNSQILVFFGHPLYFGYQDFISLASDFSFQRFNAGKLREMLQLI